MSLTWNSPEWLPVRPVRKPPLVHQCNVGSQYTQKVHLSTYYCIYNTSTGEKRLLDGAEWAPSVTGGHIGTLAVQKAFTREYENTRDKSLAPVWREGSTKKKNHPSNGENICGWLLGWCSYRGDAGYRGKIRVSGWVDWWKGLAKLLTVPWREIRSRFES